MSEHRISVEQNRPGRLRLLLAQRRYYGRAKVVQAMLAALAVALPLVALLLGTRHPEIRPYLGLASILTLLLDVIILSKLQRDCIKRGAKVQEQFDEEVLGLEWNKLVAGSRVDPEHIRSAAPAALSTAQETLFKDWYEPAVDKLPLAIGRLLCQRTNLTYDDRVRNAYASILLAFAMSLAVIVVVVALCLKLKVDDLIVDVILPALPLFSFLLREHRKQVDATETLATLKTEVDRLWEKALGGAPAELLTANARALQDAIYRHRASSPLVFDWLYSLLRSKNEAVASTAVSDLVEQAIHRLHEGTSK